MNRENDDYMINEFLLKNNEYIKSLNTLEALRATTFAVNRAVYLYLKFGEISDNQSRANGFINNFVMKHKPINHSRLLGIQNICLKENKDINIAKFSNIFYHIIDVTIYIINLIDSKEGWRVYFIKEKVGSEKISKTVLAAIISFILHAMDSLKYIKNDLFFLRSKFIKVHNEYLASIGAEINHINLFHKYANLVINEMEPLLTKKLK